MKRARAEILSVRGAGAYHSLTIVAPEIAERARPGQFLAVRMPEGREVLLRRHFFVHQASRRGGWAGTLEFAFEARGPGTRWLSEAAPHTFLDVIGPLGTGFSYPKRLTNCLLVAEGYGAASIYFLAQELLARHKRVDMLIGGETLDSVFKPIEGKRLSQSITILTRDGSLGERGTVIGALAGVASGPGPEVVYAAGPTRMLERVAAFCRERGIPGQVALEERMACGLGLCHTCVIPLAGAEGSGVRHVRACVEGPVLNPAQVIWSRLRPAAGTHGRDDEDEAAETEAPS